MKAWQYGEFGKSLEECLTLNDSVIRPGPADLSEGDLLVEVCFASLNPVDYKIPESSGVLANLMFTLPVTPGSDFAGRIEAKHASCTDFEEGQNIFGVFTRPARWGTLGEYVVVKSSDCCILPSNISMAEGAAIGTAALTAFQSLMPQTRLSAHSHVFINGGSGGTGTFAIQFAKVLGAHVTVSCSTGNIELCRLLGADEVLDYTSTEISSTLVQGGRYYDLVIDNVGIPTNLFTASSGFLHKYGTFVQVSTTPSILGIGAVLLKAIKPSWLGGGSSRFHWVRVRSDREQLSQIRDWMTEGKVRSVIFETFEFSEVPKAFKVLKEGRTKGKIVVKVND